MRGVSPCERTPKMCGLASHSRAKLMRLLMPVTMVTVSMVYSAWTTKASPDWRAASHDAGGERPELGVPALGESSIQRSIQPLSSGSKEFSSSSSSKERNGLAGGVLRSSQSSSAIATPLYSATQIMVHMSTCNFKAATLHALPIRPSCIGGGGSRRPPPLCLARRRRRHFHSPFPAHNRVSVCSFRLRSCF